ncbi:MAG: CBS domain-containing protein, partial [Victivallaceae bacterium]|nr:CBS domain-containing protein [Victivallaceae bacterium]
VKPLEKTIVERVSPAAESSEGAPLRDRGDGALPNLIKAGDMKKWPAHTLKESDTLKYAIELLFKSNVSTLVVLDENNNLLGALSPCDLLKFCLPEHLLWTEDLGPLVEFTQFTEVLEKASDTKVGDAMNTIVTAEVNVPAVQLAKTFIMEQVREIAITDSGKFVGMVEINDFCSHLFWI